VGGVEECGMGVSVHDFIPNICVWNIYEVLILTSQWNSVKSCTNLIFELNRYGKFTM